jgi:hypothetical protein
MSNSPSLSLSLLVPYRFSLSLPMSRVRISAILFWRVNLVSFISIGIREEEDEKEEEEERKREDAPSHAREARSIRGDETIAVLHTKLACCLY